METIKKLTELAQGNDLRAFVAQEYLDSGYSSPEDFFQNLLEYGCQSGMIWSLVYYWDTHAFYDKFYDDIETIRWDLTVQDIMPEIGCGDLKNFMAWLAFEEVARDIYINELEGEV